MGQLLVLWSETMSKQSLSSPSDLTTIGFTSFLYSSDQALLNVRSGVPIVEALS
jgi:hypothetical protein